ncbi:hypothetical protein CSKR_112959, partial [Clonorchis sinensis]
MGGVVVYSVTVSDKLPDASLLAVWAPTKHLVRMPIVKFEFGGDEPGPMEYSMPVTRLWVVVVKHELLFMNPYYNAILEEDPENHLPVSSVGEVRDIKYRIETQLRLCFACPEVLVLRVTRRYRSPFTPILQ